MKIGVEHWRMLPVVISTFAVWTFDTSGIIVHTAIQGLSLALWWIGSLRQVVPLRCSFCRLVGKVQNAQSGTFRHGPPATIISEKDKDFGCSLEDDGQLIMHSQLDLAPRVENYYLRAYSN